MNKKRPKFQYRQRTEMRGLFNYLFGSSTSAYDHYEASSATDVVLPISIHEKEESEEEEADNNSLNELLEDEDSEDALAHKEPLYYTADAETRRWMDYIVQTVSDRFKEPRTTISLIFKTFSEEYPTRESVNPDAIEYIRPRAEYKEHEVKNGRFKSIFYSTLMADQELQSVACKPIPNIEGVFLVNLQHDYVYGCAIECAFFRREAEFWRESLRKFGNRRKITRACPGDHVKSDKLCAMEWILYVDQTSEFFHYCSRQLKQQNPMIEHTNHYINAERLSFYLVLFLCGEYIQPLQEFNELGLDEKASHFSSAYYANINQWKKLPLWFLDVWYAGHPKSI